MLKLNFFIHPHFIIKYYLLNDIKSVVDRYSFKGTLLDIGCGEKPYKTLFVQLDRYLGIDFKLYSANKTFVGEKPDFFFDEKYLSTFKLPFNDNKFDHTASFQV